MDVPRMSVLRWAGSKRCVTNELERVFREGGRLIETFWEPFGGSLSATMVALRAGARRVVVADVNASLVNFYRVLRDQTNDLIERLALMRDDYYENRKAYNAERDPIEKAALFFYLNRTSFNGLFRENQRGEYNVPWGKRTFSFDADELRAFSAMLQRIDLSAMGYDRFFECHLESMGPGDVVYADPPYYATFSNYDRDSFTKDDHERLKARCDQARARGARIVVSNSSDPFVVDLWSPEYVVRDFKNARLFNPNGKDRGTRNREILVTSNDPARSQSPDRSDPFVAPVR
jgi:DNA adenine methylase